MKKIFTLIILCCAMAANVLAQDADQRFVFTDLEGNVVPDGTVLTVSTVNASGQMRVPLKVRNASGQRNAVSMWEVIDAMPNGEWQTCAFGNCLTLTGNGYSPKNIIAADYDADIETEWIPTPGQYATWTATLQIHVFNISTVMQFGVPTEKAGTEIIGYGPKVTVNFVYSENAGVDAVSEQPAAAPRAVFDLSGRQLRNGHQLRRGLQMVRLADGTTVKKLQK